MARKQFYICVSESSTIAHPSSCGVYDLIGLNAFSALSFMQVVASHIFREGNHAADALVQFGRLSHVSTWWDVVPSFCNSEYFLGLSGRDMSRFT